MVRHRVETVAKAKSEGYHIRVLCRCGNNATINPRTLLKKGGKVGLSTTIDDLGHVLKCKLCGQRPSDVHVTLPMEG